MVIVVSAGCLCTTSRLVVAFLLTPDDLAWHRVVTVHGRWGWPCVELVALVFLLSPQLCIKDEIGVVTVQDDDRAQVTVTLSTTLGEGLESDSAALGSLSWYLGRKLVLLVEGAKVAVEVLTEGDCALIMHGNRAP